MRFLVAIPTPFDPRGEVDHARLAAHVGALAAAGVDGFVPTGTTGEYPYLSADEKLAVYATTLEAAAGMPVIVCPWDPSPAVSARLARAALRFGAAGVMLPPPVLYDLPQRTIVAWYERMSSEIGSPILGYHNPGSFPAKLAEDTVVGLVADGVLSGVKDSSGDAARVARLVARCPDAVFPGGDRILHQVRGLPGLGGFVSGAANLWPRLAVRIFHGGEVALGPELVARADALKAAGGLAAMKMALGMGNRSPIVDVEAAAAGALPPDLSAS